MPIPLNTPTPLVGSTPLHAALVAVVLLALSVPIAARVARRDGHDRLFGLLIVSFVGHLLGAVAQAALVARIYGNSADFQRYDTQGAALADGIRHLHLVTTGLTIPGTGTVSVVTGGVYAVVGVDQLAGFFVFTWFAWLGLIGFYRAARIALPDLLPRRYALLLFLLPSLLYWPSQAGKEALMLLCLGVAAYGGALLYRGRGVGLVPAALGATGGVYIRPHEVALLVVGFVVGAVARRPDRSRPGATTRWVLAGVVGAGALVAVALATKQFLHLTSLSSSSLQAAIQSANGHTQKSGAGFGSSHGGWSSSPLAFPRDVVTVLLEPLPWRVRSLTQVIALFENLVLVVLAVRYRRSLATWVRAAGRGGMALQSLVYCVLFIYVFAALGNIGLLERERTLLFPLLLIGVCLPTAVPQRVRGRRQAGPVYAEWDVSGVLVGSGVRNSPAAEPGDGAGEPVRQRHRARGREQLRQ